MSALRSAVERAIYNVALESTRGAPSSIPAFAAAALDAVLVGDLPADPTDAQLRAHIDALQAELAARIACALPCGRTPRVEFVHTKPCGGKTKEAIKKDPTYSPPVHVARAGAT